jgi:threonine/homoserine/homoserine lactone efflux protein
MASSIASLVYLLLVIEGLHLLTLLSFLASSYRKDGGAIFLAWLGLAPLRSLLHLLQSTLITMI